MGGNSKFGRFEAADLRAVRLDAEPLGSIFEALIPFCWIAVTFPWPAPARVNPGGLKAPSSAPGGVGNAFCEGYGVAEVAPGQYSLVCATCVLRKSTEGNCTGNGRLGSEILAAAGTGGCCCARSDVSVAVVRKEQWSVK